MKKYFKFSVILVTLVTVLTTNCVFAGFQYLWKVSDATYVSSEHGDEYTADTYYGVASVRGTDRGYNPNYGNRVYYIWTKITYDVQGDISSVKALSGGKNDSSVVKKKITVKDKWNFGKKTRAYYDYDTRDVDTNSGPIRSRIENNSDK